MRYNDREPIYLQIMNEIITQIALGSLTPGMQLPTIKEQAAIMRVNPNTVARVYALLEQEGVITKQKGLGTFVNTSTTLAKSLERKLAETTTSRFVSEMSRLGLNRAEIEEHLRQFLTRH
ncbi:MAG: HTH-type transcriptional repressor YtrA [Firmicutes bacterium]|nr:HTH-type transcriptional repressor YtrA [Bacillota bacterium]